MLRTCLPLLLLAACSKGDEVSTDDTVPTDSSADTEVGDSPDPTDTDAEVVRLAAGDLVITEIMYDPLAVADDEGEWFEVFVAADAPIDLQGLVVADDAAFLAGDVFVVDRELLVEPGDRIVFGHEGDAAINGGIAVDFDYAGIRLGNGGDDLHLGVPDGRSFRVIDAVSYDELAGWPMAKGASLELSDDHVDATANDAPANWCLATSEGTTTDRSSPGAPSSGC